MDNIRWPPRCHRRRGQGRPPERPLRDDFIALPRADSFLGERGVRPSGGQRQRISIARAIRSKTRHCCCWTKPPAPSTPKANVVQAALEAAMEGRTTLVIAHRLATIQRADRIVVLDRDRVADVGHHEELVARGGLYARLAAMQFGFPWTGTAGGPPLLGRCEIVTNGDCRPP